MKKQHPIPTDSAPVPKPNRAFMLAACALFLLIGTVYVSTLVTLYPNLPVIERAADRIPGFEEHYPPFRTDENVYYEIAGNILDGSLYDEAEGPERAFSVGFPLVAAPFVAVMGKMGGYAANMFMVMTSLAVFFLLLRRYGFRARALIFTAIMAFASLNWFYAVSNYSEPLAQLLVALSLWLVFPGERQERKGYAPVAAGALTALTLFVRPNYILLAAPLFLYLALRRHENRWAIDRHGIYYAAGVAGVMALWMIRNAAVFGSPVTFEYTRLVGAFTPGMTSQYMQGNIWLGLHRLLFDEYHGLLTITPVFLLFPAGLRAMWNRGLRGESLALLAATVIMVLFVASGPYPFTEFGLGSRHLVPLAPILLFPAAFFLDKRLFSGSLVAIVTLYSFYHAGIGWFTGGEPGMGFYLGILNDAQARATVLARKGLLPRKQFESREALIEAYRKALQEANLHDLFQTLDPIVIEKIRGNERTFMLFLRSQPDPVEAILTADPNRGIVIRSFSVANGFSDSSAPADGPAGSPTAPQP